MAKMKMESAGFDNLLKKLSDLHADTKKIAEKALQETHKIVTNKAEEGMANAKLPARGKYSKGDTLKTLRRTASVEWNGSVASVPAGFDIDNGGLTSIFLMYGTPKMKKDQALYNAFYSSKTKKEITNAQEEIFYNAVRELER